MLLSSDSSAILSQLFIVTLLKLYILHLSNICYTLNTISITIVISFCTALRTCVDPTVHCDGMTYNDSGTLKVDVVASDGLGI